MQTKQNFPFQMPQARFMTPMEQVVSLVWLAQNHSLRELRVKQQLILSQIDSARKQNNKEGLQNLQYMYENVTAAVCYQSFKDDSWTMYIYKPLPE